MPTKIVRREISRHGRGLCTCLDNIAVCVKVQRRNEMFYAAYRIDVLSSHTYDDSLRNEIEC